MLNYVSILVVSVVAYLLGMLWYSPLIFGRQWMKLSKIKSINPSAGTMVAGFISAIVINTVLSVVIGFFGATTFVAGMKVALLLWIGFVATMTLGAVLYEKMPMQLYWIHVLHYFVTMVVAGGLLAAW